MLKKPSILACLGIYCSVFADFALFAEGYVSFSSFTEGLTQGEARGLLQFASEIKIPKARDEFFSNF